MMGEASLKWLARECDGAGDYGPGASIRYIPSLNIVIAAYRNHGDEDVIVDVLVADRLFDLYKRRSEYDWHGEEGEEGLPDGREALFALEITE
jgi:hypothetical protein